MAGTPKKSASKKGTVGSSHPSYVDMVKKALATCRGFQKMSRQAVSSFIKSNYGVDNKVALNKALKSLVESGSVTQAKASYKLAPGVKSTSTTAKKPSVPKKTSSKKPVLKKSSPKRKTAQSKPKTTKPTTKKTVPKKKSSAPKVKKTVAKKSTAARKTTASRK